MSDSLIIKAIKLATDAHTGQRRKYTGDPFIIHPMRVAHATSMQDDTCFVEVVAAAWCHDVVEDTDIVLPYIESQLGKSVASLVWELTNPSKLHPLLNREQRKAMDREHMRTVSHEAKVIKLIDRLDNLRDMRLAGRGFAKLYAKESRQLVDAIGDANDALAIEVLAAADALENPALTAATV